jgi:sulfide:quinone oxidoreductase
MEGDKMKSRVLVLGAGFGGLELATLLSDELGAEADVTVIDKGESFVFGFSKLEVAFGKKTLEDVSYPYRDFEKPGVRLMRDTVTAIDPEARMVTTESGSYTADYLVVALGADVMPSATPGLAEIGTHFYSVDGAERVCAALPDFKKGHAIIGICGFPYKCPPAPTECALMLDNYLRQRGLRDACEITLVSPLSTLTPVSQELSDDLMHACAEAGVNVYLKTLVTSVEEGVATLDNGEQLPFDLFLGVPKHAAPKVVRDSDLTESDWISIDLASMETAFPDVYAIGDAAKTGLPKAGSFAESQASAVASGILSKIRGGEAAPNTGSGECQVEFGDGRVSWADADFLSGPKLRVVYNPPSLKGRKHKEAFAKDREVRWFGE